MQFPLLFSPITLGSMALKNRVVMSPMLTNYSDSQGRVVQRHLAYYGARASGGTGLIEIEATAVHPGGRGFPLGLGCWDDSQVEGLSALAGAVHQGGAKAVLQIFHAGRQTNFDIAGTQPVAPSAIPCPKMREMPRELSPDEITGLVEAFAQAARRAKEAGFDGVELHGAHGYLINQFLSPYSNHRTDSYGGDLRGRTRFAVEIIRRVRDITAPDYPVLCRISANEFVAGGIDIEEARRIARVLEDAGMTAIHVSAGVYGCVPPTTHCHGTPFAVFSDMAEKIKASVSIPVITVGRITRPATAETLIQDGKADLIALGRAHIADPEWAGKAQQGRPEDIIPCVGCNACNQRAIRPDVICLVNPMTGREDDLTLSFTFQPKRVAVVGGGLPGLIAARMAAERGHRVVLFQQGDEMGGLVGLRGQVPRLGEWTECVDFHLRQAALTGVEIRPGADLSPAAIKRDNPDVVIMAITGPAVRPDLAGLPEDRTFTLDAAMSQEATLGKRVALLGGGLMGTEAAYLLASRGKEVTIIEEGAVLAYDTHPSGRYYLLQWLGDVKLRVLTGTKAISWSGDTLQVSAGGRTESLGNLDSFVLALGYRPAEDLQTEWQNVAAEVYFVGDVYEAHSGTEITCKAARIASSI